MTYKKKIYNLGPYQEGNKADISWTFAATFPLAGLSATLVVKDPFGKPVIKKASADGEITLNGQTFFCQFTSAEMTGISGKNNYEIDFIDSGKSPFATIGGLFVVERQINTYVK